MPSPSPARPAIVAVALALPLLLSGCFLIPRLDRHGAEALEDGRPLAGAWLGAWPTDDNDAIDRFERKTGVRLDLVDVYLDWFTPVDNVTHTLRHIGKQGALPVLTWEAQTLTTQDILSGKKVLPLRDGRRMPLNAYLGEFAEGVCETAILNHQPILIRVLHEMNGDWFAWGIAYERDGQRPNTDDGYVDFVGIDGYNWGTRAPWGWQDFATLFQSGLCTLESETTKPILIAEIGSSESGGDKAAWIEDMLNAIRSRDRVMGFVWLNHEKYEVQVDRRMDWNVDSSPDALRAFAEGTNDLLRNGKTSTSPEEATPCT